MNNMRRNSLKAITKSNRKLLDDFCIEYTHEIEYHIAALYPDELAINRYIRGLIKEKLE